MQLPRFRVEATILGDHRNYNHDTDRLGGLYAWATVDTPEEAKAIVATFPKSWKVWASTVTSYDQDQPVTKGLIRFHVSFASDGVNKGVNETGIKRARKFLSKVEWYYEPSFANYASEHRVRALLAGDEIDED